MPDVQRDPVPVANGGPPAEITVDPADREATEILAMLDRAGRRPVTLRELREVSAHPALVVYELQAAGLPIERVVAKDPAGRPGFLGYRLIPALRAPSR